MKVNSGQDTQALQMGGGSSAPVSGTASSAPTATTLTDSTKSWTTNQWTGHMVAVGTVFGVVLSNTATVLTVDMWHASDGAATENVGTTPSNGATYNILPGGGPAWYMALSVASRAPAVADTFLTNDGTTVSELWASGGGLNRKRASWSHTSGTNTWALAATYTMNSNDGVSVTVQKIGTFPYQVTAAPTTSTGVGLMFETALSTTASLVPGDQVIPTDTVTQ